MIEAGQLHLPRDAPWLAEFTSELLGFPSSRFDDQVDALSQLLSWANRLYDGDYTPVGGYEFTAKDLGDDEGFYTDDAEEFDPLY